MIYVVGSGPSGVAAAMALIGQGHQVTMLDAGLGLEPEREQVVLRMSGQRPEQWTPADLTLVKDKMVSSASGIPLKYLYGSDFPYRHADRYLPTEARGVGITPSFARGGFGNVWGAVVLPYLESELTEWPVAYQDLAPHYGSVLSFMGISGESDELEKRFPLFTDKLDPPRPSRQAEAFLTGLRRNRDRLEAQGILFGRSRIAVAARNGAGTGCVACGLCMYGCPYGLIYNPASTLSELIRDGRLTYRPGILVERFVEVAGEVRIDARDLTSGEPVELRGSRLYVAAGPLSSTRMLLHSLAAYNHELTLRDSQYFLLPMLQYARVPGATEEGVHTLSQVFLEIFDEEVSTNSVHLQVYTYNELFRTAVQSMLKAAYRPAHPAVDALVQRLMVIQGYLHSDLSGSVSMSLAPPVDGSPPVLRLTGRPGAATRRALRRVVRKLRRNRSALRALPLGPGLKVSDPGRGFHSGATLPMRERPGPFETDPLGRPHGFELVHIVDSSVFPTLTASTITLTVMANAHRIGSSHGAGS